MRLQNNMTINKLAYKIICAFLIFAHLVVFAGRDFALASEKVDFAGLGRIPDRVGHGEPAVPPAPQSSSGFSLSSSADTP